MTTTKLGSSLHALKNVVRGFSLLLALTSMGCAPTEEEAAQDDLETLGLTASGSHGFLIKDQRRSGCLTAEGGAREGARLIMQASGCSSSNPDFTWTYRNGRLISDRNPALSINAWGGARHGGELRLTAACTSSNPDCTWSLVGGEFRSDRNRALAINAWGGAREGAELRLHQGCAASNPDCTWVMEEVMLSPKGRPDLALNAWGGAVEGAELRLHNGCTPNNPDCTWTFDRGLLFTSRAHLVAGTNAQGSFARVSGRIVLKRVNFIDNFQTFWQSSESNGRGLPGQLMLGYGPSGWRLGVESAVEHGAYVTAARHDTPCEQTACLWLEATRGN